MSSDRDRLIELLKETEEHPEKTCPHYLEADCFDCPYDRGEDCDREARKADYLLANGVIVPPCKVGDTVYYLARNIHTHIEKVTSGKVVRIAITESGLDLFVNNYVAKLPYGKRSFLTPEEAEKALERSKDND